MANTTATGSVAMSDVIAYVEKHPVADGQKGYPKGSAEANGFLEWYRKECGGVIKTNRNHEYRNTKDNDRLDQHARWHLRKAIEKMTAPAKPAKTVKGETGDSKVDADEHGKPQSGKRQATRRAS